MHESGAVNKTEVQDNYVNRMKAKHVGKILKDKRVAFITGVDTSNIGLHIANTLCRSKVDVHRHTERQDGDLGNVEVLNSLVNLKYTDTLIACHGYTYLDWIENQSYGMIMKMVNDNLTSVMMLAKKFVAETIGNDYKKQIIIIGSMGGKAVLNGSSPYCAAKAGLIHFVKCIAWELAPKGYDVFIINPSNVQDAPMSEQTIKDLMRYRGLTRGCAEHYWSAVLPKKEFLTKCEISNLVLELMSGKLEYLSGCSIDLIGGQR